MFRLNPLHRPSALFGAALIAALVLMAAPLSADPQEDRTFAVTGFHVLLSVDEAGRYEVTEELTIRFSGGTFTEGFRNIPIGRVARLDDVSVTSPDVEVTTARLRTTRREAEITWDFPAFEGEARFILRYQVTGGLGLSEDRNVIDWDAVGSAWSVPMDDVRVTLRFPTFGLDSAAFQLSPEPDLTQVLEIAGAAGDAAPWPVLEARWMVGAVPAETPYRILATFPEQIPLRMERSPSTIPPFLWSLLGAFFLGLLAPLARARRVFSGRTPVQKQGLEPSSLPPAWLARLEGRSYWQDSAVTPTLVRLARDGHLTMEEAEAPPEDKASESKALQVRLHARPEELPWSTVLLLKVLAGDPLLANLSGHLKKDRAQERKKILSQVEREMEEAGLLESLKDEARLLRRRGAMLAVAGILAALALGWSGLITGGVAGMIIVFSITAGSGLMLVSLRDWRLTPSGAETRAKHLAFARQVRKGILDDLRRRPERAQNTFIEHLEILLGTARHDPLWMHRVQRQWKRAGSGPILPPWLQSLDTAGKDDDDLTQFFLIYLLLWTSSSPGGLAQHGKPPATGIDGLPGGSGIGASGGFGGGGGGFK